MEERWCGRPTKSGKPCRLTLNRWERACSTHATLEDQAYARGWIDGAAVGREGWQDAMEAAKSELRVEIENQIRREKAAEEERRNFRTEVGGKQIVSVSIGGSRLLAYTWDGEPLAVGDRVLLPPNWLNTSPFEGEVAKVGSSYQGPMVGVLRKLS
jgi:hypothetical protein